MWHREPLRSTPRPRGMRRNWLAMFVLGVLALGCAGPGTAPPQTSEGNGLDPRTDECSQPVRLRRTATVVVHFRGGDPCSVTLLPDGGTASDRESSGTETVTLITGHCTVEPLRFDGRRWVLPWLQQFGWGGGEPNGWAGTGTVERDSMNQVLYTDQGGAELMLIPSDSPAAQPPKYWGCE